MDKRIINLLVTFSNVYGLLPIYYSEGILQILVTITVLCSFLMHISETKHSLPGIYPFNKFSNLFLWLDRIFANTLIIYLLSLLYLNNFLISIKIIIYLICGFTFLFISERITDNIIIFSVTHSLWHILAYHSIYLWQLMLIS